MADKDPFYIAIAGVGGMGAGLLTEILVRAAHAQGLRVLFTDKKGLAVRNGAVTSQILLSRGGGTFSPVIPQGNADLLLGLDVLEAARLSAADPARTSAVVDTAEHLTVRMLLGKDRPAASTAYGRLKTQVRPDALVPLDASRAAEHFLGNRLYANLIVLGGAFQQGFLPLDLGALETAIRQAVRPEDRAENLEAFRLGRRLAVDPSLLPAMEGLPNAAALIEEKTQRLQRACGRQSAEDYRFLVNEAVLALNLPDDDHRDLALRVYELTRYENIALAQRYVDLILKTAKRDRSAWGFQATRAVMHNAFKVMAIKDEVYVADLLTREEKHERDAQRYGIHRANGDRVSYRHFTRPEFVLFGRRIRWSMVTRDWQLSLIKRMKFLRRWLSGWHAEERRFRDWYLEIAARFHPEDERTCELWLNVLRLPEKVTGYREIRIPKMEEARRLYDRLRQHETTLARC